MLPFRDQKAGEGNSTKEAQNKATNVDHLRTKTKTKRRTLLYWLLLMSEIHLERVVDEACDQREV